MGGNWKYFQRGYFAPVKNTKKIFIWSELNLFLPSHLVVKVPQAAVALCCSVELCDQRDIEAVHELLPYGLAQAVAECHAHLMLFLHVPDRLVQQVAADFTNVLHNLEESGSKWDGEKTSLVTRRNTEKNY